MYYPNEIANQLTRMVLATRDEELDCNSCFDQLDRFVELELAGLDAEEALPLVAHHLSMCKDCHEEFEMLRQVVGHMGPRWIIPRFLTRLLRRK